MNELLSIIPSTDHPISGRELHDRLGIETPYHKWLSRMCEYGFEEGKDFLTEDKNVHRSDGTMMPQMQRNHMLTLSMAKELCMLQRTARGREVRRYLISVEEAWNSPDAIMERALSIARARVKALQVDNSLLTVENQIMRPKAEYFDRLVDRNLLTNLRDTAKQLHQKPKQFIQFLLDRKYLFRDKRGSLKPYASHVEAGLFEVKECSNDKTEWRGTQTLVTPKGRETFYMILEG